MRIGDRQTGVLALLLLGLPACMHSPEPPQWTEAAYGRWSPLAVQPGESGLDKLSSRRTKIRFNNAVSDASIEENQILMNGSGVAAADIDGDGWVDLYFARLEGANKLYRNLGGGRFKEVTDQPGLSLDTHHSTGTLFADVNGDGHPDLLVSSLNTATSLFLNDGTGRFTLAEESGLGPSRGGTTLAMADVNGDGYPDLYLVNYRMDSPRNVFRDVQLTYENMLEGDRLIHPYSDYFVYLGEDKSGVPVIRTKGTEDQLFFNNGDGTFREAGPLDEIFLDEDGNPLGLQPDWGLSAKFQDLNGDGEPDLYVANDFWTPDRIWMNRGDGTFQALDTLAIRNSSYSSMAVDFSDIDRDGHTDIFVAEMLSSDHGLRLRQMNPLEHLDLSDGAFHNRPRYNRNSLYVNRGDGTFAETSFYSGVYASDWSWASSFVDIDLDGYEDLIVNTGFRYDMQDLDAHERWQGQSSVGSLADFPELRLGNRAFRNNGDYTFTDVSRQWGFLNEDLSFGMALADLTNDGLPEIIVNRMNDPAAIYQNRQAPSRVAVRLIGEPPNVQAVGATVELRGPSAPAQSKQIVPSGGYLSGSDPKVVFAAGIGEEVLELTIRWPDGGVTRVENLVANRQYEILESRVGKSVVEGIDAADEDLPVFNEHIPSTPHRHTESEFHDFSLAQPLLPDKLSRLGPGVAMLDLSGEGDEEILIGTGRGGKISTRAWREEADRIGEGTSLLSSWQPGGDVMGMAGWIAHDTTHVVMGISSYEQRLDPARRVQESPADLVHVKIYRGIVQQMESIGGALSATGPLAIGDYSGDGVMDLFVGGQFVPGRYPVPASSRLFTYEDGRWVEDLEAGTLFRGLGLVTDALFVDLNLSGEQDLVLATEWGRVRVFENRNGQFHEQTEEWGLSGWSGRWRGLAVGDFNEDGYPDVVATNWGENSTYVLGSGHPRRLYYEDITWDGKLDIIDAYYEPALEGYVPRLAMSAFGEMTGMVTGVRSNLDFASRTVDELFGTERSGMPYVEANTFSHHLFLNEKGRSFDPRPLPAPAQWAPSFYAGVADMDNDGHEDLYLGQNFFGVRDPESTPRLDSGRGLWLKGDGTGTLTPVDGRTSGIRVYGEQRGAALGDLNRDGRTDLVVSQNGHDTRFFVNQTTNAGLRVQLEGPCGNQTGIGSSLRLIHEDGRRGPARVVGSSGYGSQNSAIQVMGIGGIPSEIEVQWFDGVQSRHELPESSKSVRLRHPLSAC